MTDIQQYIYSQTKILLPISGGNGQSQDQAVVIDSKAKYMIVPIENEYISIWLNDVQWDKVDQSLMITDDGKKYDKIIINHFLGDVAVIERVFWFDITECFGELGLPIY
jgi:hypothetical protein